MKVTCMEGLDPYYDVLATDGDMNLGGNNVDKAIFDHFKAESDLQLADQKDVKRLMDACRTLKEQLSTKSDAEGFYKETELTLTRQKLEELIDGYLKRAMDCMESAIERAKVVGSASEGERSSDLGLSSNTSCRVRFYRPRRIGWGQHTDPQDPPAPARTF